MLTEIIAKDPSHFNCYKDTKNAKIFKLNEIFKNS